VDDVGLSEFAPEPPEGDLNRLGEWIGMFVPDLLQEVFRTEWRGGRSHQGFQDRELGCREIALLAGSGDEPASWVEFELTDAQDARMGGGPAPCETADSEDELRGSTPNRRRSGRPPPRAG
jgi:hypothetical protein